MRFCYRILEKSTITTTVSNNVMVPEVVAPTSSEIDTTVNAASSATVTEDNNESLTKTDQQVNERVQGKHSQRDDCEVVEEEDNDCTEEDKEEDSEPPMKKLRLGTKENNVSEDVEDKKVNEEQSQEVECNVDDNNMMDIAEEDGGDDDDDFDDNTEKNEKINNDFQTEENVNENEASNGAEDETPEDFILQNDQPIDISDDLEEDDDEDRLRICDPEEDVTEDRTADEAGADPVEEPVEAQAEEAADDEVNTESHPQNQQQQQPDNEEVEEERPKEVHKSVEFKTKKKNKKGKHHHHHRHKRDYPPSAQILHSDTKNDIMKLKVKLTAVKSDENSKYYKFNSHSPSRHKHYIISEELDNVSNHSQDVLNADDDSRNSQLTDDRDIDVRSVASSKEGHDSDSKGSPASSSHSVSSGSKHDSSSSNKERLLQMRAVRHKNVSCSKEVSSNGSSSPNGRTMNDMNTTTTAKSSKSSIMLQPPSSITVSKITAAEKRKMDEEKLLMMSGKSNNNGLDNNRPSVEIMLVNAPKQGDNKVQQGDRLNDKAAYRTVKSPSPLVNIIKTTAPMASPTGQRHQSSVSITSKLHNKIQNVKTSSASPNSETQKAKYSLGKSSSSSSTEDATGNSQGKRSGGTHDAFGVLDLSGKSSRKSSRSSMSPEASSCPSPNQNALSMAQTLVQRHLPRLNHSPVGRSSSNSPSDVTTPTAHGCSDPGRALIPASMWNLMTLSDTAVHIRNMKSVQDGSGKHHTANSQKNMSPQRSLPSPSKSSSTTSTTTTNRSSPAPLKIPVPNLTLNNKNLTNKNRTLPNLNEITAQSSANRTKTGMIHNRNNNIPLNKPGTVRSAPGISVQQRPGGLNFSGMLNRQGPSPAVAKKQAGINGRGLLIPPPPPVIPISSILKMENMTRKYDIDKVASGLTAVKAAVEAYGGKL